MPITNIGNAVAIAMITVEIRPKIHAANNNGLPSRRDVRDRHRCAERTQDESDLLLIASQ